MATKGTRSAPSKSIDVTVKALESQFKKCTTYKQRESFFAKYLGPFYEEAIFQHIGDKLYELSSQIEEQQRRCIAVAPYAQGSIIDVHERYHSLEDWRKLWEDNTPTEEE